MKKLKLLHLFVTSCIISLKAVYSSGCWVPHTHVVHPADVGRRAGEDRGLLVGVAARGGHKAGHTVNNPLAVDTAVQGAARVTLQGSRGKLTDGKDALLSATNAAQSGTSLGKKKISTCETLCRLSASLFHRKWHMPLLMQQAIPHVFQNIFLDGKEAGPSAQWETLNVALSWKRRDSVLTSAFWIFPPVCTSPNVSLAVLAARWHSGFAVGQWRPAELLWTLLLQQADWSVWALRRFGKQFSLNLVKLLAIASNFISWFDKYCV